MILSAEPGGAGLMDESCASNLETNDLATSSTSSFKTIDNHLSDSSTCSSELLNMSINSKQLDMKDDCADLNQILNETLELTKLLTIKSVEMDAQAGQTHVALAEAEVDDDDAELVNPVNCQTLTNTAETAFEDVEFMDKDTSGTVQIPDMLGEKDEIESREMEEQEDGGANNALETPESTPTRIDPQKIITEINKRNTAAVHVAGTAKTPTVVLNPEERISSEAKEYWATIDLYNNSKLAFNKRCKSVKQKREKLNAEWEQRQKTLILQQQQSAVNKSLDNATMPGSELGESESTVGEKIPEICTCVKCSIVYHEALIRGITDVNAIICNKCNNKLIYCRCCASGITTSLSAAALESSASSSRSCPSTDASSISTSSSNISSKSAISSRSSNECTQLEDKIFSIKNELINLSETSLDVFQLLLQLSDTMLELNSQINSSSSSTIYNTNQQIAAFNNFLESSGLSMNNFPLESNSTNNLSLVNEEETYPMVNSADEGHFFTNSNADSINAPNHAAALSMASKIRSVIETCTSAAAGDNRTDDSNSYYHQSLKIATPAYYRTVDPGPMSPRTANSITNIINSLNKKAETSSKGPDASIGAQLLTPVSAKYNRMPGGEVELNKVCSSSSSSFRKPSRPLFNQAATTGHSPLPSPCSSCSSTKLIENLYDKTSVTQFVDNLLNQHNNSQQTLNQCSSSAQPTTMTDCLSATSEDYSIEEDCNSFASVINKSNNQYHGSVNRSTRLSTTTLVTGHILAKQQSSLLLNSKLNEYNLMGGSFRKGNSANNTSPSVVVSATSGQAANSAKSCAGSQMKSSSSATSSSSGSGGSSSLCFSSNIDLTSLPSSSSSSTNIVDENTIAKASCGTVSRRSLSSVKSAETPGNSSNDPSHRHSTVSTTASTSFSSQKLSASHSGQSAPQPSSSSSSSCSTSAFEMVNNLLDSASPFDNHHQQETQSASSRSNTLPKDKSPSRPSSTQPQSQRVRHQVIFKPNASLNMSSHRSNSVNYKNNQVVVNDRPSIANQHLANVVAHDAGLQMANRKPSFKFESSILNRVQTMNLNKIKCLNNKSSNGENSIQQQPCESSESSESTYVQQKQLPIIKQSHHQQGESALVDSGVKRKHSINRQPIIAMPTSSSLLKAQHDLTNKHLMKASSEINKSSAHQVSIDSGIYVPPESDESSANLPNISLVH